MRVPKQITPPAANLSISMSTSYQVVLGVVVYQIQVPIDKVKYLGESSIFDCIIPGMLPQLDAGDLTKDVD